MALTDNIVAYWKFDESSGNASDSTAGGWTLTNTNTATYVAGKINNGVNLVAASSQYLTNSTTTGFAGANYSISCWVKRASIGTTQVVGGNGSGTVGWAFFFTTGNLISLTHQGVATVSSTTAITSTASFFYVVGTYNGTTAKLYINGTLDNSGSLAAFNTPVTAWNIGANEVVRTNFFDGIIDECGVWSRELTAGEVTSLYNGGAGLSYPFSAGGAVRDARNLILLGVG